MKNNFRMATLVCLFAFSSLANTEAEQGSSLPNKGQEIAVGGYGPYVVGAVVLVSGVVLAILQSRAKVEKACCGGAHSHAHTHEHAHGHEH